MLVRDALRRSGVGIPAGSSIFDAAAVMEASGVGALVVFDGSHLAGVVTDRDLVRRALARRLAGDARVDSVMTAPVATIEGSADLDDAYVAFRATGVRRLAVLDDAGRFSGMLSLDDLLLHLSSHLRDVTRPVAAEVRAPHHDSLLPVPG